MYYKGGNGSDKRAKSTAVEADRATPKCERTAKGVGSIWIRSEMVTGLSAGGEATILGNHGSAIRKTSVE